MPKLLLFRNYYYVTGFGTTSYNPFYLLMQIYDKFGKTAKKTPATGW